MSPVRSFSVIFPILATSNAFHVPVTTRFISRLFSTELKASPMENSVEKNSVFVGNLPIDASDEDLRSFFDEKVGSTYSSLRVPRDRKTGKPRGFAYLEFEAKESAKQAIESLTGSTLRDRPIKVDLAESKEDKPERTRSFDRPKRDLPVLPQENSVYIGNLDFEVTESDLVSLCDSVLGSGQTVKVRIAMDRETNRARGFAHIDFVNSDVAKKAVAELNRAVVRDREIRVDFAQRKEDRPALTRSSSDSFRPNRFQEQHSVFIGNLAWDMTTELVEEMINDVLGNGLYTKVRLATDRETGRSRGFGHIDFKDAESAQRAIAELNGMEVLGRQLRVDLAQRKDDAEKKRFSGAGGRRFDNKEGSDNYSSW